MNANDDEVLARVARLVEEATEGVVSSEVAYVTDTRFLELGMSSLSYLRLIDAVENEFGVYVDLEDDTASLITAKGIAAYVEAQCVPS
jgi:acyl carrier protein